MQVLTFTLINRINIVTEYCMCPTTIFSHFLLSHSRLKDSKVAWGFLFCLIVEVSLGGFVIGVLVGFHFLQ